MGHPRQVGVLLTVVLLVGAPVSATVAGTPTQDQPTDQPGSPSIDAVDGTDVFAAHTANNSTHHEDPDTVDESGSLADVSGWLAGYLVDRLSNSSLQLSQSQYDQARSLLGDAFGERVAQLVDVAGETNTDADDRTAARLQETKTRQQQFINRTQTFREVLADYREARRNGNTARARRLARRLTTLQAHLQSVSHALQQDYATLANLTGESMTEPITGLQEITANISTVTAEVERAVFLETQLSLTAPRTEISFLNPLNLTGRLVTDNGSAISNRTVTLRIGGQTIPVTTNASGWFTTTYRPTTLSLATDELTAQYVPQNSSRYLGTTATLPVTVTQVTPTLSVTTVTDVVQFGDTIRVSGRVTAADIPAAGVPVHITIAGVPLGQTTTHADGEFTLIATLPATVPAGTQDITAEVAVSDAALASVTAKGTTRVEASQSRLTVAATETTGTTLRVNGTLTGAGGMPVGGQTVVVEVAGSTESVTTTANGRYATTIQVPGVKPGEDRTVTISVDYDGAGTNLRGSSAATSATVTRADTPTETPRGANGVIGDIRDLIGQLLAGEFAPWVVGLLGVGILAALAGIGALLRSRRQAPGADARPVGSPQSTPSQSGADAGGVSLVVDGDPDAAVRRAFAELRGLVAAEDGRALTHWEVYTHLADSMDGEAGVVLREVTETYERAAYAPGSVSAEDAERVVGYVRALVSSGQV